MRRGSGLRIARVKENHSLAVTGKNHNQDVALFADFVIVRFHFVYEFLGLPYQDVTLLPPKAESKL